MYELKIRFTDNSIYLMVEVIEYHFNSTIGCLVVRQEGIETLLPQSNIKSVEAVSVSD